MCFLPIWNFSPWQTHLPATLLLSSFQPPPLPQHECSPPFTACTYLPLTSPTALGWDLLRPKDALAKGKNKNKLLTCPLVSMYFHFKGIQPRPQSDPKILYFLTLFSSCGPQELFLTLTIHFTSLLPEICFE